MSRTLSYMSRHASGHRLAGHAMSVTDGAKAKVSGDRQASMFKRLAIQPTKDWLSNRHEELLSWATQAARKVMCCTCRGQKNPQEVALPRDNSSGPVLGKTGIKRFQRFVHCAGQLAPHAAAYSGCRRGCSQGSTATAGVMVSPVLAWVSIMECCTANPCLWQAALLLYLSVLPLLPLTQLTWLTCTQVAARVSPSAVPCSCSQGCAHHLESQQPPA